MRNSMLGIVLALAFAQCVCADQPASSISAKTEPLAGHVIYGERVDPSTCGPGELVSLEELIARDKAIARPTSGVPTPGPENKRDDVVGPPVFSEDVGGGTRGGSGTVPNLLQQFQGVVYGDAGQFSFPPDTHGSVGPTQFAETTNTNWSVYTKNTGARVVNVSLSALLPGTIGDARVIYDQYSNRWIVSSINNSNGLKLAVSSTSSASGGFFVTNIPTSGGGDLNCRPDYPTLGVDANGIYIAGWMELGTCSGLMAIFAIDKAPLIAPVQSLGTVTAFRGLPNDGAIQPCCTFGTPAIPGEYFISTLNSTSLRVRRVNPPLTAPTLTDLGAVSVNSYFSPPNVPSMGSGTPLENVGSRLMNAVYRDGFIYTCHCISGGAGAACRWYKIAESPLAVDQSGTVSSPSLYYFYPSVTVNSVGNMAMGFSGANSSTFASCYYTGRLVNDPPGEMGTPVLLKAGAAAYTLLQNGTRNRWGDYSYTCVDPDDGMTFWTIQEYAHATNTWGTWVGRLTYAPVDLTPPTPNPETFAVNPQPASDTSIFMQATLATDADNPPVEYFFDYVSGGGGHDSGWQASQDYTDTGLLANSFYNYRCKARDSATPNANETGFSATVLGATAIETPTGVSFGATDDTSIVVNADGTFSNLNFGSTGFFFEMTPPVGSGANVWVTDPTTTVTGLVPCTQYDFRVKARNFQADETPFTAPAMQVTTGCTGCALLGDVNGNLVVEGGDIAGFTHVKLGVPGPGEFPECADYGTGTVEGDTDLFVIDLLGS